jgi:hypothetical protein
MANLLLGIGLLFGALLVVGIVAFAVGMGVYIAKDVVHPRASVRRVISRSCDIVVTGGLACAYVGATGLFVFVGFAIIEKLIRWSGLF